MISEPDSHENAALARRVRLLSAIIFIVFIALAARLVKIQYFDNALYAGKNEDLLTGHWRWSAWRGDIQDAKGRLLATSVRTRSCAMDPKIVAASPAGLSGTIEALADALDLNTRETESLYRGATERASHFTWIRRELSESAQKRLAKLSLPGVFFPARKPAGCALNAVRAMTSPLGLAGVIEALRGTLSLTDEEVSRLRKSGEKRWPRFAWVRRRLPENDYQKVRALGLRGVHFPAEYQRRYPQGKTGSHILGFSDLDGKGLEGIEKVCHPLLLGIRGAMSLEKDAIRRRMLRAPSGAAASRKGYSVVLSIDSTIQMIAEEELNARIKKFYGPSITGVALVVNPHTGDVLAMANYPTFDPNAPTDSPTIARLNNAVASSPEPGSMMKAFTLAIALQKKSVSLNTPIFCENGSWRMANRRVLHDAHGYGSLTAEMVVVKSSNIGIAKIAATFGMKTLHDQLRAFGFGEKTGINLPAEVRGKVIPFARWTSYSAGSVPMGQEIMVTPIQLVMAYSVIANGGELLRPRIIKEVQNAAGEVLKSFAVVRRRRVLKPKTAHDLRTVLRKVVTHGTARRVLDSEFPLAGKTGTAQLPVNRAERRAGVTNGYSPTRYAAGFIGMAPYQHPQVVVLVQILEPVGNHYGGVVSAPAVKNISDRTISYLKASAINQ